MIWLQDFSIKETDRVLTATSERDSLQIVGKDRQGQYRCLVRVLAELQMDGQKSFGLPLKDLQERTSLPAEGVLSGLGLLEHHHWLEHRVTQVGTAGPYDTYYRLKADVVTAFVHRNGNK